eukprot:5893039-Prymnesium_polylepis.1
MSSCRLSERSGRRGTSWPAGSVRHSARAACRARIAVCSGGRGKLNYRVSATGVAPISRGCRSCLNAPLNTRWTHVTCGLFVADNNLMAKASRRPAVIALRPRLRCL